MCGFAGFVSPDKNKKKIIKDMSDLIAHRGPDSSGYYTDESLALGFRRLSIIDLSSGNQPIYNEDKSMVIVFNGEIYNYQELKEELIKQGHIFKTNTDTEVLIHGYEEYHELLLNKLRGMFSFIIYDKQNETIFGARDFYGIKPMYYYHHDDTFMFASEIKSFLAHPKFIKELNRDMLKIYLTFQYAPTNETFFKNVYKLLPGHYFTYHQGNLEIHKYYQINMEPNNELSLEEWEDRIDKSLNESIKYHKISDVEVGSFLSSGVDSSIIATLSNVDKTFTVGYENKKYSEINYAKDLSKKIKVKNISKKISKKEFFQKFGDIQYYMDEPLADSSAVALYFVANIASKHVKVALSGEGADEIFGGYNIYHEPFSLSWYYKIPYAIRKCVGTIAYPLRMYPGFNFLNRRGYKLEQRYVGNAYIFNRHEAEKILKGNYKNIDYRTVTKKYYQDVLNYDDVTKMQYIDINTWLIGDILLKADKMSMANSLEVRVPFLDRPLIDNIIGIPTKYKIVGNETKYAFRQVCKKYLDEFVANKKKLGFPVPIREWIKEDDIYQKIYESFIDSGDFFQPKYLIKLLNDHRSGKRDNSRKIWTVYTFLVWYKEYFIKR